MCPIQFLDPMRSRAGQKATPRFFNGPPKGSDRRIDLRIVGGFVSIKGHFNGKQTVPCTGEPNCSLCAAGDEALVFEYLGALLNGHADEPVNWCVPPELVHYLGEPPYRGLLFTTWRRPDGTIKIERSRKAGVVLNFPEIDIWKHCLIAWGMSEATAGPRPQYEHLDAPDPEPDILPIQPPQPTDRESYEKIASSFDWARRKTGGA